MQKTALVVGANGVIATNLIHYLLELDDWKVIGLSRRSGIDKENLKYVAIDLLDVSNVKTNLAA